MSCDDKLQVFLIVAFKAIDDPWRERIMAEKKNQSDHC